MSTHTREFSYTLPEERIASHPSQKREEARMLVLHRESGKIEHRKVTDFPSYLSPHERVVLNDSRVIRARVYADDGKIELLLLRELEAQKWTCLGRPGKRLRVGSQFSVSGIAVKVESILEDGERVIVFDQPPDLEAIGELPIPPYMKRRTEKLDDERYQTVYARHPGSIAAPTAGLHFTKDLLSRIPHAFLTLHVGVGTFRPVTTEWIEDHSMHSERYEISGEAAKRINEAKSVTAVGTTVTRVLESQPEGKLNAIRGETDIFIYPPYTFRRVDHLLTNFHLPCSTLLMLVCAFAGKELTLSAYAEAVKEKYRFFSYGDCMLIL